MGLGQEGVEQTWVQAAQLSWHHPDSHKFWMCRRLRIAFLSSAPKRHPDFVVSAFRLSSLIKNETKVLFDMLPCVEQ